MCRLTGILYTGLEQDKLVHIVDTALIYSAAVEQNLDGWGITDGRAGIKSATAYHQSCQFLYDNMTHIDWTRGGILVHARKASHATFLTQEKVKDSHPYNVKVQDKHLFLMHQGLLQGLPAPEDTNDETPTTDTYRGVLKLARLIEKHGDITPDVFHEFSAELYDTSTFSFLLSYGTYYYAVAGHKKYLHMMQAGGGWVLQTSATILEALKQRMRYFGVVCSDIHKIPDSTLLTFSPSGELTTQPLMFSMRPAPLVVMGYNTTSFHRMKWREPPVLPTTGGKEEQKIPLLEMGKTTAPMRTTTMLFWYLWNLRSESRRLLLEFDLNELGDVFTEDVKILIAAIEREEKTFHSSILEWANFMEVDSTGKLLTKEQRKLINIWNKKIHKDEDVQALIAYTSIYSKLFWKGSKEELEAFFSVWGTA